MSTLYKCDKCNKIIEYEQSVSVNVENHTTETMDRYIRKEFCVECAKPVIAFLKKQLK